MKVRRSGYDIAGGQRYLDTNWHAMSPTMVQKALLKIGKYKLANLSLNNFHCINCIDSVNYLECFSSIVGPIAQLVRA